MPLMIAAEYFELAPDRRKKIEPNQQLDKVGKQCKHG